MRRADGSPSSPEDGGGRPKRVIRRRSGRQGRRRVPLSAAAVLLVTVVAGCGSSPAAAPTSSGPRRPPTPAYAVGTVTATVVDATRPTPAWGGRPAEPTRTLVTTVWYPAVGTPGRRTVTAAIPDRHGGPYPLIVFGHGLGASPQDYAYLLSQWAAAGFVVAAPRFPLSSDETPGGPDAADIGNQPGDMSAVITAVTQARGPTLSMLSGLVDPQEVGAAGHSNGAITTLGLVANTCCLDPRVKAAVVMAGTTEGYPSGRYVLPVAPPLLLVHGTDDAFVPYRDAVLVFNQARGPKGLLTVHGGSHASAAGAGPDSSPSVIQATIDFFDVYLRHDQGGLRRLSGSTRPGVTSLVFVPTRGATTRLPVPALPAVHLHASVSPSRNLTDGQTVTVRWGGYTVGKVVNVLQCSHLNLAAADSSGCDFSNAVILRIDLTGSGSLAMKVVTGPVGDGVCDAQHSCIIVVNDAGSNEPALSRQLPITFAP